MSDTAVSTSNEKKASLKLPLMVGFLLAILGGGGGFFLSTHGLGSENSTESENHTEAQNADHDTADNQLSSVAFVPVQPIVVSLGPNANSQHLRLHVHLEVPKKHQKDVENLMPRVVDALNSYLQVLDEADLTGKASLLRLRSQMLRRVKLVIGKDRVQDLLIMEFVMN